MVSAAVVGSAHTVDHMFDFLHNLLEVAGDHTGLVVLFVFLCATLDAALGLGALVPGETAIVLAAVALADMPAAVGAAAGAAALGAFAGDHIGFGVGRRFGPSLGRTKLIRRLGAARWEKARYLVGRQFWTLIVARQLPGVRTLVAAAAGASGMPYRRFALVSSVAASLWASLWVVGGALLGQAVLNLVQRYGGLALLLVLLVIVVLLTLRWARQHRRSASSESTKRWTLSGSTRY